MLGFFLALLTRSEVDFYDFLCCVAVIEVFWNCSICVRVIEVYRNPTVTHCGLHMSIATIARCSGVSRMPGVPKTRTCHNFAKDTRCTCNLKIHFLISNLDARKKLNIWAHAEFQAASVCWPQIWLNMDIFIWKIQYPTICMHIHVISTLQKHWHSGWDLLRWCFSGEFLTSRRLSWWARGTQDLLANSVRAFWR